MLKFIKKIVLLIVIISAQEGIGFADNTSWQIKEPWRNVFAGQTAVFHLISNLPNTSSNAALWRLSHNGRTLAQGTIKMSEGTINEFAMPIPAVQEGVMIPADLTLLVDQRSLPLISEKIYIYSSDPFLQKKQWLTNSKIGLYDPEKTTQSVLEQMGLPLQTINSLDALSSFEGRLLIVGQNVDLGQNSVLWDELLKLSERNIPVLVLSPQKGRVKLDPEQLFLSREKIIRTFDKNLDTQWAPGGRMSISGVTINSEGTDITGKISSDPMNWPWVELTFKSGARIIICGFDFISTGQASPAPRYFLARIIEFLTDHQDKETMK